MVAHKATKCNFNANTLQYTAQKILVKQCKSTGFQAFS